MSPRDWGVCPKCEAKAKADQERLKKKTADSYGKVTIEEWLKLKAKSEKAEDVEETLRINYDFAFTDAGQFELEFRFNCDKCDFQFWHEETVDVPKLTPKGPQ